MNPATLIHQGVDRPVRSVIAPRTAAKTTQVPKTAPIPMTTRLLRSPKGSACAGEETGASADILVTSISIETFERGCQGTPRDSDRCWSLPRASQEVTRNGLVQHPGYHPGMR